MSALRASARVETTNAERYTIQLCKHFRHKVIAEYADRVGDVDFKFGKARIVAHNDSIEMDCEADSVETLARVKYVLEDHLLRFAWREKLPSLTWSGPATPAPPIPPGSGVHRD